MKNGDEIIILQILHKGDICISLKIHKIINMKIVIKFSRIMCCLLLIMPLVDIITGNALSSQSSGLLVYLGQLYRVIILIYASYIIYSKPFSNKELWLPIFTFYVILLVFFNYARFNGSIIENLSYTMKLLLPIYLIISLKIIIIKNYNIIDKLFKTYSWIYPLSLLIPWLLNVGYNISNYTFESGYRGFYFANNELNVILMVIFVYCYQELYDNLIAHRKSAHKVKIDWINIIKLFLNLLALFLIGSKTSILAIMIVCFAYLYKKENLKKKLKYIILFTSTGIVSFILIINILSSQISNMFQRIIYSYNRFVNTEGVITFLLSTRNLRIKPGIQYWFNDGMEGLINFLFGVGKSNKCPNNGIGINAFAIIEMDFFDCLFWFGFIASCIVFVFYLSHFIRVIKIKNMFMEKSIFILVFSFSILAGHVIISANSGTIFALVIAKLYTKIYNLNNA